MISSQNTTVKQFPEVLFTEIKKKVLKAKAELPPPWIAAFDADGTLWDIDVGHIVFENQIKHALLSHPPANPWEHYINLKKENPPVGYLWLAQVLQNQNLSKVREQTSQFIKKTSLPIFESMRNLIQWLISENIQVYVVTASIKWSVEPAAALLGIPQDQVLGVQTKVINDKITDIQEGYVTWKEGKPKQLLLETNGVKPILACGNTIGDLALIESASHVQLAVMSQGPQGDLYKAEKELWDIALSRGYFTHSFQ